MGFTRLVVFAVCDVREPRLQSLCVTVLDVRLPDLLTSGLLSEMSDLLVCSDLMSMV